MKRAIILPIVILLLSANLPAQSTLNTLFFSLTDGRKVIVRSINRDLLLRVVKDSSVKQKDYGWMVQVVRKPYKNSSSNLLYHSRGTLGAHPSQVYAWHVSQKQFPNERALKVAGYPITVRIELLKPAVEGEG